MRLPAFGREVAMLLRAGRRPVSGRIVVTTLWNYATKTAHVVCDPSIPPEHFDMRFLQRQEVVVVVPEEHEEIGHRLLAAVRRASPKRALLIVYHHDGRKGR